MADSTRATIEEPEGVYPRRYWWLKRILSASAIVMILLATVELWWRHAAETRLAARVAQLRAAGDPASVADLEPVDLLDGDNAAYYLKLAAAKINPKFDSPANSNATFNDNIFPYSPKWFAMEEAAAGANPGVFTDLREARRHSRAKWTHFTSPLTNVLLPHLNPCRALANHAADYAMLLHFKGNDAEAIETLNDVFAASRAIDQEPFLVSHLVASGIRALATARVQLVAPALTVRGVSSTTNPSARPASREQVEQMIALLLDNQFRTQGAPRALAAERVIQIDYITNAAERQTVLRPMLVLDAAHAAGWINRMSLAAPLRNWPTAEAALSANPPTTNPARIVGQVVNFSLTHAIETDYQVEEEQRAAAVSLAVRLYRLDHADAPPATLDALVPKYLPDVPLDPMAPGSKKLGYVVLDQGRRAIVYSVGEDGVDDTAAGVAVPVTPNYYWNRNLKDVYHELLRWNPPPSTQPADSSETSEN